MEMETLSDGNESEQIADTFLCCVCLDLLYKPVVLACGHASCFWCIHKSMNGQRESHCPICRHAYYHFPTICQMLHSFLLKMYPLTYKGRENQILEEEKNIGTFSPKLDVICASHTEEDSAGIYKMEINVEHDIFGASDMDIEFPSNSNGISQNILIDDMLCATCKQLLVGPVVLNCGHVYCESCLVPVDGPIKCQICQSPHPSKFPKVYLDLDHFVEEHFSKEYLERKNTVQLQKGHLQHEHKPIGSSAVGKNGAQFPTSGKEFLEWYAGNITKVHTGVGCDYCGMYPIIGDRYKCCDCKESIGFDLCGDCYNTQSKLPGRFNQQHTSNHRFENVKSLGLYNTILKLLRGQSEISISPRRHVSGNGENIPPSLAEFAQENMENAENVVDGPSAPGITEYNQDDIIHRE